MAAVDLAELVTGAAATGGVVDADRGSEVGGGNLAVTGKEGRAKAPILQTVHNAAGLWPRHVFQGKPGSRLAIDRGQHERRSTLPSRVCLCWFGHRREFFNECPAADRHLPAFHFAADAPAHGCLHMRGCRNRKPPLRRGVFKGRRQGVLAGCLDCGHQPEHGLGRVC